MAMACRHVALLLRFATNEGKESTLPDLLHACQMRHVMHTFQYARPYCTGDLISCLNFFAACSGQYGSRNICRARNTMSACPRRMIWSTCSRRHDHAHCRRADRRFPAHPLRKRHLVTRASGNLCIRDHPARGTIDQIHPLDLQFPGQLHGMLHRPTLLHPVARGNAHEKRIPLRPHMPHRMAHLAKNPDPAVFKNFAVIVDAMVPKQGEKFIKQIPVRRVDFHDLRPGIQRPPGCRGESVHDALDSLRVELLRLLAALVEWNRARCVNGRPAPVCRGQRRVTLLHGELDAPLARPACASCIPGTAPCSSMKRNICESFLLCASLQIPRSSGLMRPSGSTAAASVNTSPAPPTARLPRWTRCQSLANPSTLEYWHIGDTPEVRFAER